MYNASLPAFCHAFNPVWLLISDTVSANYTYTVKDGSGNSVFVGTVTGQSIRVNLSDFVRSIVPLSTPDNFLSLSAVFTDLANFVTPFSVDVTNGITPVTLSSKAVPGGIPLYQFRKLANNSTTAFDDRFFNKTTNFILSTRGRDKELFVRETELAPIVFFPCFTSLEIRSGIISLATYTGEGTAITKAVALNLDALRKSHFSAEKHIFNRFDFFTDGNYVFSINILESKEYRGYGILFRNSLGVFEKVELIGEITYSPEQPADVDYLGYDLTTDSLSNLRERAFVVEKMTVEIGYQLPERRIWMKDLLNSDECYLCVGADRYECKISEDVNPIQRTFPTAEGLLLNIQLIDSELLYAPEMSETVISDLATGPYLEDNNGKLITDIFLEPISIQ
jgi:hypothetical protein